MKESGRSKPGLDGGGFWKFRSSFNLLEKLKAYRSSKDSKTLIPATARRTVPKVVRRAVTAWDFVLPSRFIILCCPSLVFKSLKIVLEILQIRVKSEYIYISFAGS